MLRSSVLKLTMVCILLHLCSCAKEKQFAIGGISMEPSYKHGQIIFMKPYSKAPQRWDVVLFNDDKNEQLVFRIVGLPGEVVDLTATGLHIDGTPLSLVLDALTINYELLPKHPSFSQVSYPLTLGSDSYFLLGDNPKNSFDSRCFAEVAMKQIIGKIQ